MASQSLPIPADGQVRRQESAARGQQLTSCVLPADSGLLVAGFGDAVAADYAAYACRLGNGNVAVVADEAVNRHVEAPARVVPLRDFSQAALKAANERGSFAGLILFLNPRLTSPTAALWTTFSASPASGKPNLSVSSAPFACTSATGPRRRPKPLSSTAQKACAPHRCVPARARAEPQLAGQHQSSTARLYLPACAKAPAQLLCRRGRVVFSH